MKKKEVNTFDEYIHDTSRVTLEELAEIEKEADLLIKDKQKDTDKQ